MKKTKCEHVNGDVNVRDLSLHHLWAIFFLSLSLSLSFFLSPVLCMGGALLSLMWAARVYVQYRALCISRGKKEGGRKRGSVCVREREGGRERERERESTEVVRRSRARGTQKAHENVVRGRFATDDIISSYNRTLVRHRKTSLIQIECT